MCFVVSKVRRRRWNKNQKKVKIVEKDIETWYCIWEQKLLESARNCDVSSCIYYLKFTFKGPEYTRDIVSYDSLADSLKY